MCDLEPAIWLIVLWLIAIGGAVGSFLNVVVYRLPLGISIVHPPSHCPKCGKTIAWYDNVPVFGWLVLRGRCRQCHNPISARYPIVEAITAAMFGMVAIVEMPYLCKTGDWGLYPYHILLLCTLLSAALIEYDGNRVPWKLFVPALVVGLLMPMVWTKLPPRSVLGESQMWFAIAGALGLVTWVGIAAWMSQHDQAPTGPVLGLVCVGQYFGWHAAGIVAIAAVCLCPLLFLGRVWPKLRILPVMFLWGCTLTWILAWASLV